MQRFHAAEGNMQGAIHRGAGALEDADHAEGLVVVLDQADGGHAMGQHQLFAETVVQRPGHFRTEHHLERVLGEGAALADLQRLAAGIAVMLEIGRAGAHHPVAAVRVAEGDGDGPLDLTVFGEALEAVPANVVGRIADAEHRIQQQVDAA
ncbi:hypothetical protein D3C80_1540200 [compost metagenome]